MTALLGLVLRRLRGRLVKWSRLARQPKYLVGFVVAAAYYGWILFGRVLSTGPRGPSPFGRFEPEALEPVRLLLGLAIAALLSLGYVLFSRPPLSFDEAEIQYLFTAPVPRRSLIRHALLKFQPGLLVGSFVSVMLFGRGDLLERAIRWPAIWALFTAWFLWTSAQAFWKARLAELPSRQARIRRLATWSSIAVFWLAVVLLARDAWLASAGSTVADGSPVESIRRLGEALSHERGLRLLVAPFELPLWTLLATSAAERVAGWAFMAALLVGLTEWCARSPVSFEDDAVARARRVSDTRARGLSGALRNASPAARRRRPFELAATGAPEMGIAWKNLVVVGRLPLRRAIAWGALALAAILAGNVALGAPSPLISIEMMLGLMFAAIFPLAAGSAWRNDLRVDLLHVDHLRTWPVPAHRLVAAEIGAPALATTLVAVWALALGCVAAISPFLANVVGTRHGADMFAQAATGAGVSVPALTLAVFVAALPLVVAFAVLSCTLQNLGVLLLPGWTRLGAQRAQGPAVVGQQLLLGVGRLVAMAVGLVPGAIVVAGLALAQRALGLPLRPWELPAASTILAVPILAEAAVLIVFAGRLWERMDPSRELLEGSG